MKISLSSSPSLPPFSPLPLSATLTEQQQACVQWARNPVGHLIIEAVAGSGKTYTIMQMIIMIVNILHENGVKPQKLIALMAFNAKVRDELKHRVNQLGLSAWVEVNTVHGFGFAAYKKAHGPTAPNNFKLSDILAPWLKQHRLNWELSKPITTAVSIAKDSGMGIFFPNNTAEWRRLIAYHDLSWNEEKLPLNLFLTLASDLFHKSLLDTSKIDFSDMIYMPLKNNLPFPQFDFVFIDEAQDTNATRREVAKRMLQEGDSLSHILIPQQTPGGTCWYNPDHPDCQDGKVLWEEPQPAGHLIAVGDRHQAIYGFTGADNDALDLIKKEFSASELPLSTCFRCAKSIISHAQKLVSHIQPRCGAITGEVILSMPEYNFHENLFAHGTEHSYQTSAILCRKNAPLISLAFQLVNKRIPCRIEGKDTGQELIKLCKKFKATDKPSLLSALNTHLREQSAKLPAYKLDILSDKISAITFVLQLPHITSLTLFYQTLEQLFSDYDPNSPPKLTLSSIHKSKGLEWPTVYLLGRNAWMPSPFATQPWMQEQETNLTYVAITRAMEKLIEVHVEE